MAIGGFDLIALLFDLLNSRAFWIARADCVAKV